MLRCNGSVEPVQPPTLAAACDLLHIFGSSNGKLSFNSPAPLTRTEKGCGTKTKAYQGAVWGTVAGRPPAVGAARVAVGHAAAACRQEQGHAQLMQDVALLP